MASSSLADTPTSSPAPLAPPSKPPVDPKPWQWRCHVCGHIYRLSCTRRCLSCSHRLCFSHGPEARLINHGNSSKKALICNTNFDFHPWSERNEWRRDAAEYNADPEMWEATAMRLLGRVNKARPLWQGARKTSWFENRRREARKAKRLSRFRDKTHDCTIDCAYPSECIREYRAAQAEELETSTDDDSSSEDEEASSTSNQETPSGTSKAREASSLGSYKGKPRRFRHLRWQRDTSGLNPQRQSPIPESPKSPESP